MYDWNMNKDRREFVLSRSLGKEWSMNMKNCVLFIAVIILFLAAQIDAQTPTPFQKDLKDEEVFPEVPRISAYEAYVK